MGCLVLVGLGVVLLDVADYGKTGTLFGLLLSVAPAPLFVAVVLAADRLETEPPRLLALTFLWGASVAVLLATVVNTLGGQLVGGMFGRTAGDTFLTTVSAPVVEECLKGAAIWAVFRWKRDEFNGVVDGIVYAGMVGLGFGVAENVQYYARALVDGQAALALVIRGVFSPFAHPLFSSMVGVGLAVATVTRSRRRRRAAPLLGLLGAVLLHSLWNSMFLFGQTGALVVYLLVFLPLLGAMVMLAKRGTRHEGTLIRSHLQPEVAGGALTDSELEALATQAGRREAVRAASRAGGREAGRLCRDLHRQLSELAFLRYCEQESPEGDRAEQEQKFMTAVNQLHADLDRLCGQTAPEQPGG